MYLHRHINLVLPFIVGDKRIWSNAAKVSSCFKLVSESYVCMYVTLNTHVCSHFFSSCTSVYVRTYVCMYVTRGSHMINGLVSSYVCTCVLFN